MGNSKRFIQTLFTSGIAMLLSFLISFLLTPYITEKLGTEAYGFVTLAKNFTSYAGVLTIALNSYAARFIAIEYHKGNIKKANGYFSSVFAGNVVLTISILFIAFVFVLFIENILVVSDDIVISVKILFLLVFFCFGFTTIGTAFSSSAIIKNHLDKVGAFRAFSYIIEIVIYVVLFSFLPAKVWYVGFALLLASIVVFLGNIYVYKKYTPDLCICRQSISLSMIKELVGNGIWNSINSLGNILNSGLDLLISNLMLNGIAMGQIAITKTLSGIVGSFNQLISQPFQPIFLKYYSDGDKESLLREFKLSMKVSGLFSSLIFAGFFAIGKWFYYLWLPSEDIDTIYLLTILTFVYMFFEGPIFPLYYIYTLTVKNKVPCIITTIGGLFNVLGMFILIKFTGLGIYAVVLTTLVIMSFISLVTNPIYMTKCLKIKWYYFYPSYIRIIISCIVLTISFYFITKNIIIDNWLVFAVIVVLLSILGLCLYFLLAFKNDEKKRAIHLIYKMIKNK